MANTLIYTLPIVGQFTQRNDNENIRFLRRRIFAYVP